MRALVFHAPHDVRCERVADPGLRQAHDVVLRVERTALCGSDLHVYEGRETGLDAGTVMGHEAVGEVVAAGRGVRGFAIGDRVLVPFTTSCGDCAPCRSGLTARCVRGELFGWVEGDRGLHGTQAELLRVPLADSTLVPVPAAVPPELALLAGDVLATGTFAVLQAGVAAGTSLAVLGCGAVGLSAILAARRRGAEPLYAIDGVAERLALAGRLGAAPVALAGDVLASVREATEGRGVDAVVEAVGSPAATRLAYDLLRPGGVLVAVGVHTEPSLAVTPGELYDKNLTYRAGRCPARALAPDLLADLAAGRLDPRPLLTHHHDLAAGPDAYAAFARREGGRVKVVLSPGD